MRRQDVLALARQDEVVEGTRGLGRTGDDRHPVLRTDSKFGRHGDHADSGHLAARDDPERLPEPLRTQLGTLQFVLEVDLVPGRTLAREDPDVVLIGEMRDLETIESALRIAETGHLTFGTLHTNSASSTINRIIDVFPAHQQPQIRAQLSSRGWPIVGDKKYGATTQFPGGIALHARQLRLALRATAVGTGRRSRRASLTLQSVSGLPIAAPLR